MYGKYAKCTGFLCLGPKNYTLTIKLQDGSTKYVTKAKGIRLNCVALEKLRPERIERIIDTGIKRHTGELVHSERRMEAIRQDAPETDDEDEDGVPVPQREQLHLTKVKQFNIHGNKYRQEPYSTISNKMVQLTGMKRATINKFLPLGFQGQEMTIPYGFEQPENWVENNSQN
jgi:hypothetical protein